MWGKALMMVLGTAGGDNVTPIRGIIEAPPPPPPVTAPFPRTAQQAASEFLREMQELAAGGELQIKRVQHSYDKLAPDRGWPAMSTKALSMHLVGLGCKRTQLDLRKLGQGRPTALRFPPARAA